MQRQPASYLLLRIAFATALSAAAFAPPHLLATSALSQAPAGPVSLSIGTAVVLGSDVWLNQPPGGMGGCPQTQPLPDLDCNLKMMQWTITGGQVCATPGSCTPVPGAAGLSSASAVSVAVELTSNPARGFPMMGPPCMVTVTYAVQRSSVTAVSSWTGTVRATGAWAQLNGQVISAGQPLFEVGVPWPSPFTLNSVVVPNTLPQGLSSRQTQVELSPNSPRGMRNGMCGR